MVEYFMIFLNGWGQSLPVETSYDSSLNMPGVGMVFDGVAGFLTLVIHLVLFDVTVIDVLRSHPEGLGEGDQEVE